MTAVVQRGRIVGLQRSDGGVPKLSVATTEIAVTGMVGDRQRNLKYHGGPERALCLFSLEAIETLRADGHPIIPGAAGENVTVAGLIWTAVKPGAVLRLGKTVVVEITSYTKPCRKIAGCFSDGDARRLDQQLNPGFSRLYARVVVAGTLTVGDDVVVEAG